MLLASVWIIGISGWLALICGVPNNLKTMENDSKEHEPRRRRCHRCVVAIFRLPSFRLSLLVEGCFADWPVLQSQ